MIKKNIIIIVLCAMPLICLAQSSNKKISQEEINLVDKLGLADTNKIFIDRGFLETKKQLLRIEITDKETIELILNELKSVKTMPLCDCIAEYSIGFYNNDIFINGLEYSIELNFIRYRGKKKEGEDYTASKQFNDIIKKQLEDSDIAFKDEFSKYYSELLDYRKKPEVMLSSRAEDHNNCEAFRKIIKKGKVFLPFIIEKMREGDLFLSQAMEEITGFDVRDGAGISNSVSGKEVSDLWIKWWKMEGNIAGTKTITRGGLKYDAIEEDPQYKEIIKKAEEEAENNISNLSWPKKGQMGYCHAFWQEKKRVLKEKYTIDWKSPAELNPHVLFD